MTNESRNIVIAIALVFTCCAGWLSYEFHAQSVERHNAVMAEGAKRDREKAFERRCRALGGHVLFECPNYCVQDGARIEVGP